MKSKKGLVIHWIILGVVAAAGLFLIWSSDLTTDLHVKGHWQLDFLENYYLEAEKDLLKSDQLARNAVWESILDLGKTGGFHKNLPCKQVKVSGVDYALWNKGREWAECMPSVEENLASRVKEKLEIKLPNQKYSEMKLDGKQVTGKGEKKSILSFSENYVRYTYDTSFVVNLNFSVQDDYDELLTEASYLVGTCRGNSTLQQCVEDNRKKIWKFKDCDDEEYVESEKKVAFCVESPKEARVYESGKLIVVRYWLALDFSKKS